MPRSFINTVLFLSSTTVRFLSAPGDKNCWLGNQAKTYFKKPSLPTKIAPKCLADLIYKCTPNEK